MKRKYLIFSIAPLALLLIGAAAVSRDLLIQNATDAPGITIVKPGSQTSNLFEAYIGSGLKGSISPDGNLFAAGYLSLSGTTNRLAIDSGSLELDGAALQGALGQNSNITVSNITAKGYLTLSGETNRITVEDDTLKLDGSAITGGGDTVWTNSAGIVTPAGGQSSTNRLEYISGAADNSTNVATVVDTANAWSTDGSRLLSLRTGGAEQRWFSHDGVVVGGSFVDTIWSFPERGKLAYVLNDVSAGEGPDWGMLLGTWETNDWTGEYAYSTLSGDVDQAYFDLFAVGSGGSFSISMEADPDAGFGGKAYIKIADGGGGLVQLDPSVTQDEGGTPHYLRTSSARTSGNLFEVSNEDTPKASITWDGRLVLAGTTNQVVFGSTNTAPSSSVAPTKWISVQVSGESAVYRVPLYE